MRLASLVLVCHLACDSGPTHGARSAAGASPGASRTHETASTAPASPAPLAGPAGERDEARFEGPPDCRFQRPAVWAGGQVTWLGRCQTGFAKGDGVLVNVIEGAEPERFYGRLEHGSPSVGVLQADGGFLAGRWRNGVVAAPLADDVAQRNVVIGAFRVASSASSAVSDSFREKDATSNAFYAEQARLLRDQMD